MRFHTLQTSIVFAFALLLLIVHLAVLLIANNILTDRGHREITENLETASHLFDYIIRSDSDRLMQAASILASDYAFLQAIATADSKTILSVLDNHGARFNASAMLLVNTNNLMIADTSGFTKPDQLFPFPELLQKAQIDGMTSTVVFFNQQLYRLVIVPVFAPTQIAWLASAFIIDNSYASGLKSLIGVDVTFLTQQRNEQWQITSTSLLSQMIANLSSRLPTLVSDADPHDFRLEIMNDSYLLKLITLAATPQSHTIVVLQCSFSKVLEPLNHLQKLILMLSGFSFFLAVLASTWIARSITTPLRSLANLAQRIQYGDFPQNIIIDRKDEIGQLTSAFKLMSNGISERESRIILLANYDPLTSLPNRTLFHDRLEQAILSAQRIGGELAVIFMDLDRFKEINDIMGHYVGDLLLQEVAKRLENLAVRNHDTLARLGGDEFAMLLTADSEQAKVVANQLLNSFDQPIILENQQLVVNISIGIVCYPEHGDEINTLLRHADLAMYEAKKNNVGYVVFDPRLDYQDQKLLSLSVELRRAVAQNELVLYYQPKLTLATGTVTHAEVLVRWLHPQHGLIPPNDFIPFAENTGFIKVITLWIIEQVIRQQREFKNAGIDLTLSINISAHDLTSKLPIVFTKLLAEYQLASDCLILEITESAIMSDPKSAMRILHELNDMGLKLSVDDFGTGYSSLAYLKKLPVSELKIDKSFVTNMEIDKDDAVIVRSTIELAHTMGLKVVAEGVENLETSLMLKSLGCDFLQGYYITRPLATTDLKQWLQTFSTKVSALI